ncbi:hypothetical protein CMO91_05125 [Candidatus Woesearchaeota archaeon]|nr:hypothetical protein [Candidatus Woesearchaeota archaeon]|tara:strand:- start:1682 stop:2305 length:624 start_codon:yes stop_codon:yes gene_type:complete
MQIEEIRTGIRRKGTGQYRLGFGYSVEASKIECPKFHMEGFSHNFYALDAEEPRVISQDFGEITARIVWASKKARQWVGVNQHRLILDLMGDTQETKTYLRAQHQRDKELEEELQEANLDLAVMGQKPIDETVHTPVDKMWEALGYRSHLAQEFAQQDNESGTVLSTILEEMTRKGVLWCAEDINQVKNTFVYALNPDMVQRWGQGQ